MRTVLLGDSHLARVKRDLPRISAGEVVNVAVGGAIASDLLSQAHRLPVTGSDRAVVSIGTNDAVSWNSTPLDTYAAALRRFLDAVRPARLVFVASPGVVGSRLTGSSERGVTAVSTFVALGAGLFRDAGGVVVDSSAVLAPLGDQAFAADGKHLTGAGYDLLLPAIAAALA